MYFYEIKAIVWICILLFFVTGVITIAALLGWVKLGRTAAKHDSYLQVLFGSLLVEIVAIAIATFAAVLANPVQHVPVELVNLEVRVKSLENEIAAAKTKSKTARKPEWVQVGVGDCSGRDFAQTSGAEPDPQYCQGDNLSAVCWDGTLFQNGGRRVWCTYKTIEASQCTDGLRPGRLFRCQRS